MLTIELIFHNTDKINLQDSSQIKLCDTHCKIYLSYMYTFALDIHKNLEYSLKYF